MKENKSYYIRNFIAITISVISISATVVVAIKLLFCKTEINDPGIDFIGKSLLPLWGTWIGTVLAFYFTKENFESAAKSYRDIIETLSPEEKLASIPARNCMIVYDKIAKLLYPGVEAMTLKEILDHKDFKQPHNLYRYAIFDKDNKLYMMVHRSTIFQFRSEQIDKGTAADAIGKLTFKEMIGMCSADIKAVLDRGYNFVKEDATLLDVKKAMDALKECQDVFITKNGKKEEPVIGLITNNMLLEQAKV